MSEKIMRISEVCERLGGISDTTLWRLRRAGVFPEPRSIKGSSLKGWTESVVDRWIEDNYGDPHKSN